MNHTDPHSNPQRLTLGLLGAGSYFRHAYLPNLSDPASLFRVGALCRRSRPELEAIGEELGHPALYTAWPDLLAHAGLEAVLISTPHHLHYEQVSAALQRGLHVLVDKPLCLDASQAEYLVRLARDRGRALSVAYNYHYWPHFRAARRWIAAGHLGRVTSVAVLGAAHGASTPIRNPNSWYHEPDLAGGGSLVSGGTHRLTAALWLTGLPPQSVYAVMRGPSPRLDYQAGMVLELEGGAVVALLNEAQAPARRVTISIFGERGAVSLGDEALEVVGPQGEPVALHLPAETEALADFYAAVTSGQPLLTSAEQAYWAVAAVQAAYDSARTGLPQPVRPLST